AVVLAAEPGDDLAKYGVAEVRVLEGAARWEEKPQTARQPGAQLLAGERLLPIAPGVVCRQAGRHGEEVANAQRWPVFRSLDLEFRQVLCHGVVEADTPLTPQYQQGQ